MSSNAFARSRPRARHQRVPKLLIHAHPRFLQLVSELERIDAVKKKQDQIESEGGCSGSGSSSCDIVSNVSGGVCSTNAVTINLPIIAECCSSAQNPIRGTTCCVNLSGAQTSDGYRSLDCNQSTSALNDNYYRQNTSNHNHQNHIYSLHHTTSNNHQGHNQQHYCRDPNQSSNTCIQQHHYQQDDRCPNKCPSGSTSTNFGYLKQGLVEQNYSSDFSTSSNLDLRQDENRSKRKRPSNDSSSSSSSKKLPTTSTIGTNSKRHKSSPEPVRPLSPSFTKCPICLLDCMDRDPSFTNTCFHLFCYVCIENWTKNKATCPLCRTKFTKIIYNIRSESCYDEKVASPIRRDDDDDRIIYDQLQGLNTNQIVSNRNPSADDPRLLFDHLRNNGDTLMQPFAFVDQIDPRQPSINPFNVTSTANFNASVPHPPFTNYNPIGPNYLLIPRPHQLTSTVPGAFTGSASLSNNNGDPSRMSRISRSGRHTLTRNYADLPIVDNSPRVSRTTSTSLSQSGVTLERQHHHQHQPHPSHHHQHNLHNQHRSTIEINSRQNQRMEHPHIQIAHSISSRYYNPSVYSRRPYTNPPIEQHILDNLYRQMPDI